LAAFGTQPTITVKDSGNNTVTGDASTVTAAISGGDALGVLVGTTTAVASSGIATFLTLGLTGTAGQTYTITYTDGALTQITQTITAQAGAATKLGVASAASGSISGVAFTSQPTITVQDSGGNVVTSDGSTVTAAISGADGLGALIGTTTAVASSGVATFANLGLTGTSGQTYTLTYTDGALTLITQTITVGAIPPLTLSALTLTSGSAIPFSPVFASSTSTYAVWLPTDATTFTLDAVTTDGTVTVTAKEGFSPPAGTSITMTSGGGHWTSGAITAPAAGESGLFTVYITDPITLTTGWYALFVTRAGMAPNPGAYAFTVSPQMLSDGTFPYVFQQQVGYMNGLPVMGMVTIFTGSIPSATTFQFSVPSTAMEVATGFTVIGVRAYRDSGSGYVEVTQNVFANPISIDIPALANVGVPSYSRDGLTWTTIPAVASIAQVGVGLLPDGYTRDSDSVTIYTTHLTDFGVRPVAVAVAPAPPAAPAPPTATVETPVTELVTAGVESTVEASIEVAGGDNLQVTVTVPVGATTGNVTVSIKPDVTALDASTGVVSIRVNITDSTGAAVTHFNKPLSLNLGKPASDTTAAYSQDGLIWTVIAKLDGTTLPDGVQEGYYVAADGSLVILTRHLTYFASKRLQATLVLKTNAIQIPLGAFAAISTTGGNGSGIVTYKSLTASTCTVNDHGIVTGLAVGTCTVSAARGGDGTYLDSKSASINLTFVELSKALPAATVVKTVVVTGTTLFKSILVTLGAPYAGMKATIQIRKVGSKVYKNLCIVTLNKAGMVRTGRIVPKGSTIRVLVSGKSQAAFVVR
jgi:hypothetical protein